MKKVLLISVLLFSCISQGFAQKTISKEDFEHLVDYANCKYTAGYIEMFRSDERERNNIDKYDRNVKSTLNKASIDKSPRINDLEQLLKNNGWSNTFNVLTQKVDDKKKKFTGNKMSIDEAINLLNLDGKIGEQLKNEKESLQREILTYYNANELKEESQSPKSVEPNIPEQDENSRVKQLQDQYESLKNEIGWFKRIALGVLALWVIVLIFIFKMLKGRESIIEIVLESERINKKFSPKAALPNTNSNKSYNLTEKDINIIVDKVQECLKLDEEEKRQKQPRIQSITDNNKNTFQKATFKYLKGKTGKIFSRVEYTPEDSFFRIANEYGDTADFEFSGNEAEAIAKRIFHDDICQILSGTYQDARSVKMIKPGKIKRIGEQWTVIEPITIILT